MRTPLLLLSCLLVLTPASHLHGRTRRGNARVGHVQNLRTFQAGGSIERIAFSPKSNWLVALTDDSALKLSSITTTLRLWSIKGQPIHDWAVEPGSEYAISDDDRLIALISKP